MEVLDQPASPAGFLLGRIRIAGMAAIGLVG